MAKVISLPARSAETKLAPNQPEDLNPFEHLDLLHELLCGFLGVIGAPTCIEETIDYIDTLCGR